MRKIMYTRQDGGLSIVTPVINTYPTRENITDAQAEARAWGDLPADAISPKWVDESAIPADRTFRNAWVAGKNGVDHDMEKCREIHQANLRTLRDPKLSALDVAYMQAEEDSNSAEKQRISALKQQLRDVTDDPAIFSARTPEELKGVIPNVLK